jgi:hypothetical protein
MLPFRTFLHPDPPGAMSFIYALFFIFMNSNPPGAMSFYIILCLSIYAAPIKDLIYFLIKMLKSCVIETWHNALRNHAISYRVRIFTKMLTTFWTFCYHI